jgi:hypothetical protein
MIKLQSTIPVIGNIVANSVLQKKTASPQKTHPSATGILTNPITQVFQT